MDPEEATNPAAEDELSSEATEVADEANAQGDDQDQLEQEADTGQSDDETEEIEHDGKKLRIPKDAKPLLMMQQDYTRKTQDLAQQRQAADAERSRQAESFEALRQDHVRVHSLDAQVKAFENVDWGAYQAQDPDAARIHYDQYRLVKDQLRDAQSDLSKKETERLESQREQTAKAIEETERVLARDIKGWGPQVVQDLVKVAAEFGVDVPTLRDTPAAGWKILNELRELRSQVKKQATTQRQTAATSVQPAKTVGAKSAPPTALDDRLSTAEWIKRRNAQEAAKRRA